SDANIGVNFAVSSPLVERVVSGLQQNERIDWRFGGLGLRAHPAKGETGRQAAEVVQVRAGSAGEAAGLMPGDKVVKAGDWRIRKPQDLRAALARLAPGDKVILKYVRDDRELRTELTAD
ncbi:MAG: PDZ domain-containing protein, partial [Aestuariivirgaceae bacterium]